MAKGVLNLSVVVDEPLRGSSFIEFVAHIDALYIVGEGGVIGLRHTVVHTFHRQVFQVGVVVVLVVIPPGGVFQMIGEGVRTFAGGIYRTTQDFAQCGKAHIAGARAPEYRLDLFIVIHKAQLHGISAVDQENYSVEVIAYHLHQILFGLGELKVVVIGLEIVILIGIVVVSSLTHSHGHIVVPLPSQTTQGDDGYIRKFFGVVHHVLGISIHWGLVQRPGLSGYGHVGTLGRVGSVEIQQFLVHRKTGLLQSLLNADDVVQSIDTTGAGTTIDRDSTGPAKQV